MSKRLPMLWPLQPHTAAKHQLLRKYLQVWMRVMTLGINHNKPAIFIDGFSGPGEYEGGEDGSPVIILKEAVEYMKQFPSHKPQLRFIFIEQNAERFNNLKGKVCELFNDNYHTINSPYSPSQYNNIIIYFYNHSFIDTINHLLDHMDGRMAPTFAFIDPFGFKDTPYEIIERFNKNSGSEIFVNFMYEDINRFLKLPSLQEHYHKLFGTDRWLDMLKNMNDYTPEKRRYFLHSLYQEQLKKAGYKYVISFELKNEKNATEYFLYYGTSHIRGLEKMKDAMWSVDRSGAYTFSDYEANKSQLKFIEFDEPDLNVLADELFNEYSGKEVLTNELKDFVITDTIFRKSVHSTAALKLLEDKGLITVKNRSRPYSYPPNSIIVFN
ncbi:three-Cys-motif partner protein TcmP [Fictibacillus sp. FJAT-27399]|uniref:three-Cys-motif partner protein TcmP n=1 Tax=Fictibacillus sp. FJAT-27399 TaxID=1729689 RepID=UPI0007825D50|nr:three-Cys-motif partner protein TcmP [Fictibacillus sp. FJAT-27399]